MNVERFRFGDPRVIPFDKKTSEVIEIGDFVGIDSNYLVAVSSIADAGDAAANREACANKCIGIAASASKATDTDPVLVMTGQCVVMLNQKTAAAIDQGDPVEIYASADHCEDQTIVEGATSQIAVCVKTHTNATTETLCLMLPSVILGTPQA